MLDLTEKTLGRDSQTLPQTGEDRGKKPWTRAITKRDGTSVVGSRTTLRGISPECVFFAARRWLNRIISFTFSAIPKPFPHYTILCFGIFVKFLDDFWVYLEGDSFSQRVG